MLKPAGTVAEPQLCLMRMARAEIVHKKIQKGLQPEPCALSLRQGRSEGVHSRRCRDVAAAGQQVLLPQASPHFLLTSDNCVAAAHIALCYSPATVRAIRKSSLIHASCPCLHVSRSAVQCCALWNACTGLLVLGKQ